MSVALVLISIKMCRQVHYVVHIVPNGTMNFAQLNISYQHFVPLGQFLHKMLQLEIVKMNSTKKALNERNHQGLFLFIIS